MGKVLDLTVQVLNLSPQISPADLNNFFSYCGTVENIQILCPNEGSLSALVSFRQPYAFQTALLLNNAILAERPICILPAGVTQIPILSDEDATQSETHLRQRKKEKEFELGLVGVEYGHGTMQTRSSGIQRSAEQAAERISVWFSEVVEKASKFASDLHGTTKRNNPNSRKQK